MNRKDPVTIVITRSVRPGYEQAFEQAVTNWMPKSLAYPGHLGVHMIRPLPGGRDYGAVLKFCTLENWHHFRDSHDYQNFLGSIRPLLEAEPQVQATTGLEGWFTPLGEHLVRVPPRWKMALVTWIGVCMTVYLVSTILSPVTIQWPWFLGFITMNACVVASLTWLVMPLLSRLLRPWLHPRSKI